MLVQFFSPVRAAVRSLFAISFPTGPQSGCHHIRTTLVSVASEKGMHAGVRDRSRSVHGAIGLGHKFPRPHRVFRQPILHLMDQETARPSPVHDTP